MGDQKDYQQETSGKGLRVKSAPEGHMAGQERVGERSGIAKGI